MQAKYIEKQIKAISTKIDEIKTAILASESLHADGTITDQQLAEWNEHDNATIGIYETARDLYQEMLDKGAGHAVQEA